MDGERLERAMGIEPTAQAWEAWVLPLYDARYSSILITSVGDLQTALRRHGYLGRPVGGTALEIVN
jgi:hypothetical protein